MIGLKSIGAALESLEETVAWARERVVLGVPLASHQAVSFSLAEAATELEFARWQCCRVPWQRQRGLPCRGLGAMSRPARPGAPPKPSTAASSSTAAVAAAASCPSSSAFGTWSAGGSAMVPRKS